MRCGKNTVFLWGISILMCLGAAVFPPVAEADEEKLLFSGEKEWEKLGLSQAEWMLIKKENLPREKVERLLRAGIGIMEYFEKPWIELGLSEEEWIRKRQGGMQDADMAPKARGSRDDWAPIHNFFLPGFHHFGRRQYVKAYTMSGIAVVAAAFFSYTIFASRQHQAVAVSPMIPLLILGGDMVWSSVDILVQINREKNPDASRFSLHTQGGLGLSMRIVF